MAAGLAHPIFDPYRRWLAGGLPSLQALNAFADEAGLRTESGMPVRFVPPCASDPYYEIHVFETGRVQTRSGNLHDLFNALAWLAFPRSKARINAMHAAQIPLEGGRRGRLRDLLTIFDEGGAIVACAEPELERMVRGRRWRELFWDNRPRLRQSLRVQVLGHAVLEQALAPYPGITCKVVFADPARPLDAQAAEWLASTGKTPRDLPPLPIFGLPGWLEATARPEFYADTRYFRPASFAASR